MSKSSALVLVVDDEESIRHFLKLVLEAQGYVVFEAESGKRALNIAAVQQPGIIILDLGLPDIDGIEVVRSLRKWTLTQIIILSVRGTDADKINALDAGADDYLTKPFSPGELMARLRTALRRSVQSEEKTSFTYGDLNLDIVSRLVTVSGSEIQLTPKEYELLKVLVTNAGRVMTHRQLLRKVWGIPYEQDLHILQVNISNLRHKIEKDPSRPSLIITDPGIGYRIRTL